MQRLRSRPNGAYTITKSIVSEGLRRRGPEQSKPVRPEHFRFFVMLY
jgi:hypothetical protein